MVPLTLAIQAMLLKYTRVCFNSMWSIDIISTTGQCVGWNIKHPYGLHWNTLKSTSDFTIWQQSGRFILPWNVRQAYCHCVQSDSLYIRQSHATLPHGIIEWIVLILEDMHDQRLHTKGKQDPHGNHLAYTYAELMLSMNLIFLGSLPTLETSSDFLHKYCCYIKNVKAIGKFSCASAAVKFFPVCRPKDITDMGVPVKRQWELVLRSGLLTAPLVGQGSAEQLLYMACHIHGVLQVKVSICIQHGVTPDRTTAESKAQHKGASQRSVHCTFLSPAGK